MTDSFRLQFISTVLWCQLRSDVSDPKNALRTPDLKPELSWGAGATEMMAELAQARSQLLRSTKPAEMTDEPASGRLLIADLTESDSSGVSFFASGGFIDEDDLPPWDTWIHYAHREITQPDPIEIKKTKAAQRAKGNRGWDPPLHVSYLLCWVPTAFVALVEKGIDVNPTGCLFWAADYKERHYNTALLRQLDADGLLG